MPQKTNIRSADVQQLLRHLESEKKYGGDDNIGDDDIVKMMEIVEYLFRKNEELTEELKDVWLRLKGSDKDISKLERDVNQIERNVSHLERAR